MAEQNRSKLKWLEREVPEGLLVTARWLASHGYSGSLRSHYLKAGWLEQPARGVFRRPRGSIKWDQAVISLQALLAFPVAVGGRTALELQGYAHYLPFQVKEIHLYGDTLLPGWMKQLPLDQTFVFRKSTRMFREYSISSGLADLTWNESDDERVRMGLLDNGFNALLRGQWGWPLVVSTPERAILELLDELPDRESFDIVDKLIEGLTTLGPKHLQRLLGDCRSIKVKRLFFFFADRHNHAWTKRIERNVIDLGSGDRMLVRGGTFDPTYRITVPRDLDAVW